MKILKSMLPITVINLIVLFVVMLRLPSSIPHHVNFQMEVDRFGSKWIVFFVGILPVIFSIGMYIYQHHSKTKHTFFRNQKAESILAPLIVTGLIIFTWIPVLLALYYDVAKPTAVNIPIDLIIMFPVGIYILVFSNFIGVIKYNPKSVGRLMGFRTPWALKSETTWKKTHRFAGYIGVISGLIMCVFPIIAFALDIKIIPVVGLILSLLLFVMLPIIYSRIIFKKENLK